MGVDTTAAGRGTSLRDWFRALFKETLPALLVIVFGTASTVLTFFPALAFGRLNILAFACLALAFAWANFRVYRKIRDEVRVLESRLEASVSALSVKSVSGSWETTVFEYPTIPREALGEEARLDGDYDFWELQRRDRETDFHVRVPIVIVNRRAQGTTVRLLEIKINDGNYWQEVWVRKLCISSPSTESANEPRAIDLKEGQSLEAEVEVLVSVSPPGLSSDFIEGELLFEETFAGLLDPVPFTAQLVLDEA